jgi:hypothetical protein
VSQNGQLLSRRGRSLPAKSSGFDTHRDSISGRFDCSLRSKMAFKANLVRTVLLGVIFGTTFLRIESRQATVFNLNGALFFAVSRRAQQLSLGMYMIQIHRISTVHPESSLLSGTVGIKFS